ncbi:bifunctional 23S rRNA (guanine(2069)-N(7))-methyltransferase RlmK/23S rRNA (guanine(2445)-N(2))-methyltransferase RlmL [Pleionea sp. CnH1-48]|uniref:bifunctional 23S rRNA (guanine(2069)-N(7))-methyltransferase RlmK/23S rRNA (guanine(2445)-N(2))-methyltransferase RlmL n=1 Tax=Pleionea sp. CnH1-48 TaxID=2954494 RepID=UPI002098679E|nr:bifunctional 23S rRNA (guanine(2069)-N(7))-methyltransferase RlmK/23S rRNA (guanine(2445)-N(2))-methyltransferase RlmL [Pleionea sp. CnH1-48]MCO7225391.1 bifunctional 23S rRNA (guanine(2069)-N(7))-methyltransferase RlmK/23S rRNA (guanine(2445)-N(2))-methyltransferase RlmL [Pleionea sp. CnH1-48]
MPKFIITSPPGFEYLLVDELKSIGVEEAKEGLTQVRFECDWETLYRVCMWSRLANRVLYPIEEFDCPDDNALYRAVRDIDWDLHLSPEQTMAVDFVSRKSNINHERYGAQKVKDAVVDYFRDEYGERPDVDPDQPDVQIHCRLNKDRATLCIDLSGGSLHQRGYRLKTGDAPLKENLAALLLYRAGWPEKAQEGQWFLDPMCGSGTLAIEAAMMAYKVAPGLTRNYWGFRGWKPFHRNFWEQIVAEAMDIKDSLVAPEHPLIIANDQDSQVLALARQNAQNAGLDKFIDWQVGPFQNLQRPAHEAPGLIVTNPPYGERLEQKEKVRHLYQELGKCLKQSFVNDTAAILSTEKEHGHALGIRARKIYRLMNGSIECELLRFELDEKFFVEKTSSQDSDLPWDHQLSEGAQMLANRIQKNLASLKSFLKQQKLSCYRIYDADLPEYAAAIDVYDGHLHIQEYAPPKSINEHKAKRRLRDIERVAAGVLGIAKDKVFVKTRSKQKGKGQYEKQSTEKHDLIVEEYQARLLVNLSDYLDTGVFLDHRKTRQMIARWCKDGHLLNLFSYTSSASVQAALAGAKTTSVDMSNTYIGWTKRNFQLNQLDLSQHQFIRANCVEWLEQAAKVGEPTYDVIFMDPPTFSNSKKMEQHFDVQKDHINLIHMSLRLLKPGGKLVFSNNFKKFKMEFKATDKVTCREITKETTSRDFAKKPLHRCWVIEKKPA